MKCVDLTCLSLATLICASSLSGQERLEIVGSEGRILLDGIEWALVEEIMAVNHEERILYVGDLSDPFAVLALSLDDGSLRGTFGAGEGDGPGELRRLAVVAAARNGVMVSDGGRVNHWDASGKLVSTWRPGSSTVTALCSLRRQPAVALFDGVLRRSPDGGGIEFGMRPRPEGEVGIEHLAEFAAANMVCISGVAYVQMGNSVMAHRPEGETNRIRIPPPLEADAAERRPAPGSRRLVPWYQSLSTDGFGRLVLGQAPRYGHEFVGALIDPRTGCYSLILDREDRVVERSFMGIYADSAIVYHRHTGSREVNGRTIDYAEPIAYRIALRPLRRVAGEPCPPRSARSP